jgi:hypothetical protein
MDFCQNHREGIVQVIPTENFRKGFKQIHILPTVSLISWILPGSTNFTEITLSKCCKHLWHIIHGYYSVFPNTPKFLVLSHTTDDLTDAEGSFLFLHMKPYSFFQLELFSYKHNIVHRIHFSYASQILYGIKTCWMKGRRMTMSLWKLDHSHWLYFSL